MHNGKTDLNYPLVAIWMVTYNQEKYIQFAIESIIQQQTSFDYKLFIGEDCSTDETRELCLLLQSKYPDKIKLLLNKTNLGGMKNALNVYKECFASGAKYIAMCEGDDYWTDTNKLQKQISFLKSNQHYSMCIHRTYELINEKLVLDDTHETNEKTYSIFDLARKNFIQTSSLVFRNINFKFPKWFEESFVGDYPLTMFHAKNGLIKYFPESMSVYRKHTGGIWTSASKENRLKKMMNVIDYLLAEDFTKDVIAELTMHKSLLKEKHLNILFKSDSRKNFLDSLKNYSKNDEYILKKWQSKYYSYHIKKVKSSKIYHYTKKMEKMMRKIFYFKVFT